MTFLLYKLQATIYSDSQCHLHFFQDRNKEDFIKQLHYFSPGYIQPAACSGQRAAGSGQRAAGSGQRAAGSGQRASLT